MSLPNRMTRAEASPKIDFLRCAQNLKHNLFQPRIHQIKMEVTSINSPDRTSHCWHWCWVRAVNARLANGIKLGGDVIWDSEVAGKGASGPWKALTDPSPRLVGSAVPR